VLVFDSAFPRSDVGRAGPSAVLFEDGLDQPVEFVQVRRSPQRSAIRGSCVRAERPRVSRMIAHRRRCDFAEAIVAHHAQRRLARFRRRHERVAELPEQHARGRRVVGIGGMGGDAQARFAHQGMDRRISRIS